MVTATHETKEFFEQAMKCNDLLQMNTLFELVLEENLLLKQRTRDHKSASRTAQKYIQSQSKMEFPFWLQELISVVDECRNLRAEMCSYKSQTEGETCSYSTLDETALDQSDTLLDGCLKIMGKIASGGFSSVARCHNTRTGRMEALKIFWGGVLKSPSVLNEIYTLRELQKVQSVYIVQYNGYFLCSTNICIHLELLDEDLETYVMERERALPVAELKSIISQVAVALDHLEMAGIVHADLKPGNIMVVNKHERPVRIKLVDFGMAFQASSVTNNHILGTIGFRAPEIILGLPLTSAIDIWSLGATALFLAVTINVFFPTCEYLELGAMMTWFGPPPDEVLDHGLLTSHYFHKADDAKQGWTFKPASDFNQETGEYVQEGDVVKLEEAVQKLNTSDPKEQKLLLDLLNKMLKWDAEERIEPGEVINHPFFLSKPSIATEGAAPDRQTVGSRAARPENGADVARKSIDKSRNVLSRTTGWFSKIRHYFCTFGRSGPARDRGSGKKSTCPVGNQHEPS